MADNRQIIHKLIEQLCGLWVIFGILIGCFIIFIYQPAVQQRDSLNNELAEQKMMVTAIRYKMLKNTEDKKMQTKDSMAAAPKKFKPVDAFLNNTSKNDFMLSLEEIAEKNNIAVENIEPEKLMDNEKGILKFKVLLTGEYFDLVSFVAKLENMQPFQQISTMNCKEKAGKLTVELEDIIFIQ